MKNESIKKYYNKIAKEYTQQHGYSEHLSIPSLKKFLSFLPANAKVLDIGCGGGQDSKFLLENNCNVLGIDISKEMIKLAKKYSLAGNIKIADIMELSTSIKYDGIWCCRVFHNISIKEQDRFLEKLNKLLKKNGVLYITSAISESKEDYETSNASSTGILKKYLTSKSFKALFGEQSFKVLNFKYWVGKKGMEIFIKKI